MNLKPLQYLFAFLFVILSLESASSQKIVLKIRAFDTEEAIPYAHARILNSNAGGVANGEGILELLITEEDNERSVLFSAIGFQTLEIPVAQLINKKIILLKEADLCSGKNW